VTIDLTQHPVKAKAALRAVRTMRAWALAGHCCGNVREDHHPLFGQWWYSRMSVRLRGVNRVTAQAWRRAEGFASAGSLAATSDIL
jgi:hypothetical protein